MYTVLYVDDSSTARQFVEKILRSHYKVILAVDGLEALRKGKIIQPDLVLTDLSMPGLNGFELATRMKAMWPAVPVVALTGDDSEEARRLALIAGCSGRLVKPVDPQALLQAVAAYLQGAVEVLPTAELADETIAYQQRLVAHLETELLSLSQANRQLAAVNQITQAVSQSLDLAQIMEQGLASLAKVMEISYAALFLYDETDQTVTLGSGYQLPTPYLTDLDALQRLQILPASLQTVLKTREVCLNSENSGRPQTQSDRLAAEQPPIIVTLPMFESDQLIGCLEVAFPDDPVENENLVGLLRLVSQQLAQAINKGRLHQELQRQAEQLKRLNEAGRALTESLDLAEVLQKILPETTKMMDVETASLELDDIMFNYIPVSDFKDLLIMKPQTEGVVSPAGSIPIPIHKMTLINRSGAEPDIIPPIDTDSTVSEVQKQLSTPLFLKGRTIGRLQVGEKRLGIFNQQDQQFLEAFSLSAVGAIENARAHSVLEAAYQELQRLDEVKDKFIQVANHELRTPLALLKGYVMLLSGDQMSVEEKSGAVDIATEQANVLQALLDRILDIERLARNEFLVELVEVDPLALTEAVVERFRLLAQSKEVALQLKSSDAVKPVWLDQAKYETVLTNLLDNAVAFAPYQGIVEVTVQVQADGFAAAVRDNGPGIPTEEHQRIFERFYQIENPLRRRHEGVGLGLSIAREMAELCGGQLEVESVVGQGATFTYRQPIKPNIILA